MAAMAVMAAVSAAKAEDMTGVGGAAAAAVNAGAPAGCGQSGFGLAARYYIRQIEIKRVLSGYYAARGEMSAAAWLESADVRVGAEAGAVVIASNGRRKVIRDAALAGEIMKIAGAGREGEKILFYGAAAMAMHCMTDDDCWNAVGDAVSAVSEWANS